MAIDLKPVDVPAVPARSLAAVNRNRALSIESTYGAMPIIRFQREVLQLDGATVEKRAVYGEQELTAAEFVEIVPEYKALLQTIPAALDLMTDRMPKLLALRAERERAAAAAQENG